MQLDVVDLTSQLVSFPSVSLSSNVAVTRHVQKILKAMRFEIEEIPYTDVNGVDKLSIVGRLGGEGPGLALMSHDDVVPAEAEKWTTDPFEPRLDGGKLYGRGSCDMKGPLAATLCAAARLGKAKLKKPLYIVVTADEEIQARGAKEVTQRSKLFAQAAKGYGLICEPTSLNVVHAHKGSLYLRITSKGKAAHTSTLKGVNANIAMIPFLQEMAKIYQTVLSAKAYRNDDFKPPHSEWSIGLNDHNIATNISPTQSVCTINYRVMPGIDVEALIERSRKAAAKHGLRFEVTHRGLPLFTPTDSSLVQTALKLGGKRRSRTVAYGTDGMAFASKMKQMVVLGPGDIAQAHIVDEWVETEQLHKAVDLYSRFVEHVCVEGKD